MAKSVVLEGQDADGNTEEAAQAGEAARQRHEKKGHRDPVWIVENLGLEVDLKQGQYRVTEQRVRKINVRAKEILCDAIRTRREVQLGREGEDYLSGMDRLGMVVSPTGDEHVERPQDLAVTDSGSGGH
ncbi:hypothetical protein CYMTET_43551 [Cymbomonas tetramitiformis]|uniref:Uncharacterized protein n=1 Tax=Cymbomonas tetramitiformis TaxID=36881 RepID=A0AAE0F065_9CHLO|nr:hypothetical protein CYMTET_43551 [Cymbomonas tetramitiformis]